MLRWPTPSLRNRFVLGLAAVLLPFILAVVVGQFYLLPRLVGSLEDIVYEIAEEMRPVATLEVALLNAHHASQNFLNRGDPAAREAFVRARRRVEEAFDAASLDRFGAEEERAILRAARAEWEQARRLAEALPRLPDPAANAAAAARDMERFTAHVEQAADLLRQMQEHFSREIGEERVKAQAAKRQAMLLTAAVFAAALAAALASGVLLGRHVLGSVDAMRRAARRMEEGDLAARVASEGNDELGELALAFNAMAQKLEKNEAALREFATRDGLTGLYNHRTFYEMLEDELARAQRFNRPVSLLLLDIDHFKRVNDTYGHLAGDAVLRGLSELLSRQARVIDRVCRYGGEEIAVMLPETDIATAAEIAERLRAAVEAQPFDVAAGAPLRITVSIGAASFPVHADNAQALVAAVDAALYAAKEGGRNRSIRHETATGSPPARR